MSTVTRSVPSVDYKMFVAGEWVDAEKHETTSIVDPSTREVVAVVPKASTADAERAVQAAREAFDEGPWPRMNAADRAAILRRAADIIRQ
jgi:acyl-CoA reductase-like NAD-dependent aldehyde dehydrogenase